MRRDITQVTGSCEECLRFNVVQEGFHPLKSIISTYPMDHTSADLICKIPKSKWRHQYLLVYMCLATRFVWLRPLKDKSAETVTREIMKIHLQFGNPKVLQTDNGKEFANRISQKMADMNEIDFRQISSYHSQGQGSVERINRDVSNLLKKTCTGKFQEWSSIIDTIAYFLNVRISSRTGSSPFVLMFGRQPYGKQEYWINKNRIPTDVVRWIEEWNRINNVVYPAIVERVMADQAKRSDQFNQSHKIVPELEKGQLVMIKDVVRTSKWQNYYDGPYEVIRRNRGGAYLLMDGRGQQLPFRITINHIH